MVSFSFPKYYLRMLYDRCALYVRYLYDALSYKYRTSDGQITDKNMSYPNLSMDLQLRNP